MSRKLEILRLGAEKSNEGSFDPEGFARSIICASHGIPDLASDPGLPSWPAVPQKHHSLGLLYRAALTSSLRCPGLGLWCCSVGLTNCEFCGIGNLVSDTQLPGETSCLSQASHTWYSVGLLGQPGIYLGCLRRGLRCCEELTSCQFEASQTWPPVLGCQVNKLSFLSTLVSWIWLAGSPALWPGHPKLGLRCWSAR